MSELIDAIGRNFERFLRWGYPGILFSLLLALGNPPYFHWWMGLDHERLLVAVVIIVSVSFPVYLLHRHVWNELLTSVFYLLGVAAFSGPHRRLRYIATRGGGEKQQRRCQLPGLTETVHGYELPQSLRGRTRQ